MRLLKAKTWQFFQQFLFSNLDSGLHRAPKSINQPFADVLQNSCPKKFCSSHRETAVLASLFNKILKAWNFITKKLQHKCFSVNSAEFPRIAFL